MNPSDAWHATKGALAMYGPSLRSAVESLKFKSVENDVLTLTGPTSARQHVESYQRSIIQEMGKFGVQVSCVEFEGPQPLMTVYDAATSQPSQESELDRLRRENNELWHERDRWKRQAEARERELETALNPIFATESHIELPEGWALVNLRALASHKAALNDGMAARALWALLIGADGSDEITISASDLAAELGRGRSSFERLTGELNDSLITREGKNITLNFVAKKTTSVESVAKKTTNENEQEGQESVDVLPNMQHGPENVAKKTTEANLGDDFVAKKTTNDTVYTIHTTIKNKSNDFKVVSIAQGRLALATFLKELIGFNPNETDRYPSLQNPDVIRVAALALKAHDKEPLTPGAMFCHFLKSNDDPGKHYLEQALRLSETDCHLVKARALLQPDGTFLAEAV